MWSLHEQSLRLLEIHFIIMVWSFSRIALELLIVAKAPAIMLVSQAGRMGEGAYQLSPSPLKGFSENTI